MGQIGRRPAYAARAGRPSSVPGKLGAREAASPTQMASRPRPGDPDPGRQGGVPRPVRQAEVRTSGPPSPSSKAPTVCGMRSMNSSHQSQGWVWVASEQPVEGAMTVRSSGSCHESSTTLGRKWSGYVGTATPTFRPSQPPRAAPASRCRRPRCSLTRSRTTPFTYSTERRHLDQPRPPGPRPER